MSDKAKQTKGDVAKMADREFTMMQLRTMAGWLERYEVKLEIGVTEALIDMKALKMGEPSTELWRHRCDMDKDGLSVEMAELVDRYKTLREFQALQAKAEKVLGFKEATYKDPTFGSANYGSVRICFDSWKQLPMSLLGLHKYIDVHKTTQAGMIIDFTLTYEVLMAYGAWIDREGARQLLAKRIPDLVKAYGVEPQMWDDRFVVKVAMDAIHRSLEYEMSMKGVQEFLDEVESIFKRT